jgi:predicted transcriptional regulator
MPEWIISLVVGLSTGFVSAYVGMKVGQAKLEWQMKQAQENIEVLRKRSHAHNEDILIHDLELEDVMRNLDIPRKKRQNWRFDS